MRTRSPPSGDRLPSSPTDTRESRSAVSPGPRIFHLLRRLILTAYAGPIRPVLGSEDGDAMTALSATPRLLTDNLMFPEGPRWHAGELWLEDTIGERLLKLDSDGRQTVVAHVRGRASGLGFMPDGTPLVMSMFQKKLFRVEHDDLVEVADLSVYVEHPVNDMIVDVHGRAYLGNFGYDFFNAAEPATTFLLRVDPDGKIAKVADDLVFPNGMAITSDGKTFYVAESYGHRITTYDIEPDGSLTNSRVHADLGDRIPDGICLDGEGALWVASVNESEFIRILPNGSIDETQSISCAGRLAIACVLGGPDGRTLFMMEKRRTPSGGSAGFVRAVEVPVARDASIP